MTVNTSGTPRLAKFYTPQTANHTVLMNKIYTLISSRPAGLCNFLDAPELNALLGSKGEDDVRVVYRTYATLCFVFVVDGSESELGILDLIQVCRGVLTASSPLLTTCRSLSSLWIVPSRTCANWTWSSISTRYAMCQYRL